MKKIKVLELFAGIGACLKALTNLGIEHEIVDAVEIDKYAIKSFNAVHGTNFEPQDITKWDKDIECDLIMHGSPCQDFSVAGLGKGGDEGSGTRSSLMYETLRIVEKLKPKYVIWENVKNLLSKKHRHNFDAYLEVMEKLGYENHYQVLNAKNYGIPQNRERVFTVSILGGGDFEFPEPIPLEKKLKDMLEDNVDEKYYLSDDKVLQLKIKEKDISNTVRTGGRGSLDRHQWDMVKVVGNLDIKGHDQIKRIYDRDGIPPTLTTMEGGNRQPKIIDDTYANREPREYSEACPTLRSERSGLKVAEPQTFVERKYKEFVDKNGYVPEMFNPYNNAEITDVAPTQTAQCGSTASSATILKKEPFCVASRGRGENNEQHLEPRKDGNTNTITSVQKDNYIATPYRIRKLTPKECWRLMGFDDSDFEKAEKVNSNTQLYKQAGNSIVVNVLEAILKNLL